MATKKYDFMEILSEYNKKYKQKYSISSDISNAVILHNSELPFDVTFNKRDYISRQKLRLSDFIYYYATPHVPGIHASDIRAIILHKEEGKLKMKVKILPSNKIRYAYLYTNYFSTAGQLGNSCMRTKEMQKALNFYIKNNVKIVVAIDSNNKIHARALLWENIKSTDRKSPFTYLDRVYSRSDSLIQGFRDLATKNKWKSYNSTSAGKAKHTYYIDNVTIKGVCHLPYTDTFRYLYYKDPLIASSRDIDIKKIVKHRDAYVTLTQTGGGGYQPTLDADRVREALTGNFISKKDAIKVKRYDGYVLKKHIVDIGGDYYSSRDSIVTKSELDGFMLKENSVNEVLTNNIINKTKAIHSPKHNGHIHKSNAVYIKGELYHTKDTNIVCFKSKWYHISDCFRNYDRTKRNAALSKKKFHFWIDNEVFVPSSDDSVMVKDGLIPKEHTIIVYDLIYNPTIDDIEYQEVYCTSKVGLIQLVTGELIRNILENKKYIKKFNNKWYIKQDFRPPNKNQLSFGFIEKK